MSALPYRMALAVAIVAMIMFQFTQSLSVDQTDESTETPANRLRFFLLSLFLRPQATAATTTSNSGTSSSNASQPTGNATNSYNTYVTVFNSTNTSGINITRHMRIIRESEMAKLEYVDDTGDNSLAMYLPDYYYDIFRNLVEVNRERTGRDLPFDGVLGA